MVCTRSGSTMSFYVNGQKLGNNMSCTNYQFTSVRTTLGAYDDVGNNTSALDYYSCVVYDRALNEDEIKKIKAKESEEK